MRRVLAAGLVSLMSLSATAQTLDLQQTIDKTVASLQNVSSFAAAADIYIYSG